MCIRDRTKGKQGAIVFKNGKPHTFPAFPTKEVDATGAGDVFAATFLHYYHQTRDIALAAAYAHSAASYVVELIGVQLPTKEMIENRFLQYQRLYV